MAKVLTFVVPGVPVAKGRPRMTRRGRVYTPAKTVAYERTVAVAAQVAKSAVADGLMFPGPVQVTIWCRFATPLSWSRKKTAAMLHQPHTQLPDLDNLVKSVLDGMNHTHNIWTDDRQVAAVTATKHWSEKSCVLVRIEKINENSHNDWNGHETDPKKLDPPASKNGAD